MAVISFDLASVFYCARINLVPVAKALTIWIAGILSCLFILLHSVFPSIAITSFNMLCNDLTQSIKHVLNASGFKAAKTRAYVFLDGSPFSKGKYWRKNSVFSLPNRTKSLQLSAPHIVPHSTTNRISVKGYNLDRFIHGSFNTPKCDSKAVDTSLFIFKLSMSIDLKQLDKSIGYVMSNYFNKKL